MAEAQPPKRTEKVQVMLDDEELRAIDDWRFDNRVPTRAAAIRELLRRGLLNRELDTPPADLPTRDFRVTDAEGT
ncbi:hypothetical protein SAMN06265365_1291 [Tistlia consotensis]|uniref:Ribbon-helix-helix protein, copG family n=1 Tax=Tistlia consotensis USBA 355 TaxID=560819 RepID=A0A1Y6CTH7_9PROT|nr:hypothetical protein [Tistlia consotensis]SMF75756.1 hypothetical protein SAMN05428998_13465 [Tistlia consotensis USBA 355]SNS07435.1 hypothetical protein SAMN06265365_1291 [Tistlia consotensis]